LALEVVWPIPLARGQLDDLDDVGMLLIALGLRTA
jgi:hypothetical protein